MLQYIEEKKFSNREHFNVQCSHPEQWKRSNLKNISSHEMRKNCGGNGFRNYRLITKTAQNVNATVWIRNRLSKICLNYSFNQTKTAMKQTIRKKTFSEETTTAANAQAVKHRTLLVITAAILAFIALPPI